MIRFILSDLSTAQVDQTLELPADQRKHAKVLRVRPDEVVELLDGDGHKVRGSFKDGAVAVKSVETIKKPQQTITLCVGLTQGGTFETILSQAVEMGVSDIIPVVTAHSAPMGDTKRQKSKQERWQKIIHEACKQSGQAYFPTLSDIKSFSETLEQVVNSTHIVGALSSDAQKLSDPLQGNIAVWIGPEGDFSETEYDLLRQSGAQMINLGGNVLRSQTASVVLLSLVKRAMNIL